MHVFFDSSALVKRYIEEKDSDEIIRLCAQAERIDLSALCFPELLSAFNRLRREHKIKTADYEMLKTQLLEDLEQANVVDISQSILEQSVECLEQCSLKALDAIQLATALHVRTQIFVTGDIRLVRAAKLLGLPSQKVG